MSDVKRYSIFCGHGESCSHEVDQGEFVQYAVYDALAREVEDTTQRLAEVVAALDEIKSRAYGQADKVALLVLMDWILEQCDKALAAAKGEK